MSMRNGTAARRRIGRGPDRNRKRVHGGAVRAFFLALILVAVGLSALAAYLYVQVDRNNARSGSAGRRGTSGAAPADVPPAAGAPSVPRDAKGDDGPPKNDNNNYNDDGQKKVVDDANRLPYPAGPKADARYARDRVYCMVPYVWNREFYDAIMGSWGRRCDVINFLADSIIKDGGSVQGDQVLEGDGIKKDPDGYKHYSEFPEGTFPDNVHFVNMTRPWTGCTDTKTGKPKVCRHIWEKMWRSWVYVGDNHLDQAEWFCKVDYDTFFFPENLQYYVRDNKGWDPYDEYHYFGTVLHHSPGRPPMVAGAAACWSRRTLADIVEVYKAMPKGYQGLDRYLCEDRPKASEEISTSMCLLKGLNVSAEEMLDEEQREYVMLDPYHNMLTWNRTEQGEWWFWKNKPANRGQMENCCSRRPMGVHKYKAIWWMKLLEEQFYGPPDNKEITKLNDPSRGYVEEVRRAMGIDQ